MLKRENPSGRYLDQHHGKVLCKYTLGREEKKSISVQTQKKKIALISIDRNLLMKIHDPWFMIPDDDEAWALIQQKKCKHPNTRKVTKGEDPSKGGKSKVKFTNLYVILILYVCPMKYCLCLDSRK